MAQKGIVESQCQAAGVPTVFILGLLYRLLAICKLFAWLCLYVVGSIGAAGAVAWERFQRSIRCGYSRVCIPVKRRVALPLKGKVGCPHATVQCLKI